jgi:hypothetical protein
MGRLGHAVCAPAPAHDIAIAHAAKAILRMKFTVFFATGN